MRKRKPPTAAQLFKKMTDSRKGLASLVGFVFLLAVVATGVTAYMVVSLLEAGSSTFDLLLWMPSLIAGVAAIVLWIVAILLSRFVADLNRAIRVAKSKMTQ